MTSILVLDDRPIERELLSTVLGSAGYEVREAESGEQALKVAHNATPDLILADILMPKMDGYEFVQELRMSPSLKKIPVVFCTATYGTPAVEKLAKACGVSHILIKPCEPEQILKVVAEALGTPPSTALAGGVQFQREHLRVLNTELLQKVKELEAFSAEERRLNEDLIAAERKGAESVTLLQTLMDTAPVGFGFVDLQFRMRQMNETLAAINGAPLKEQIGQRVADIVPEIWPQLEPTYRHVVDAGEAVLNQEVTSGENGDRTVWLTSFYPVRIDEEIIGLGIVVINITERTHAEESAP